MSLLIPELQRQLHAAAQQEIEHRHPAGRVRGVLALVAAAAVVVAVAVVVLSSRGEPVRVAPAGRVGLLPPANVRPGEYWYVRSVGILRSRFGVRGLRAQTQRLQFESWTAYNGEVRTRWTPLGQNGPSQTGLAGQVLGLTYSGLRDLPSNPRALLVRIRAFSAYRRPGQTFAAVVSLLEAPTTTAVHAALLRAATSIAGVRAGTGADWIGRSGHYLTDGTETITFDPSTGAILGDSNPVQTAAFLDARVVRSQPTIRTPPTPGPLPVTTAMVAARLTLRALPVAVYCNAAGIQVRPCRPGQRPVTTSPRRLVELSFTARRATGRRLWYAWNVTAPRACPQGSAAGPTLDTVRSGAHLSFDVLIPPNCHGTLSAIVNYVSQATNGAEKTTLVGRATLSLP